MCEDIGSKKTEPSPGRRRRRPLGIAAGAQFAAFLTIGAAVLLALFYDSRLYYGIDVDGQPIYQELVRPETLHGDPISVDSTTRIGPEGAQG